LANQPYLLTDVGALKATILASALHRAVDIEIDAMNIEPTEKNCRKLLTGSDLVIDAFDIGVSR